MSAFKSVAVGITYIIDSVDSLNFVNYFLVDAAASVETTCFDYNFLRNSTAFKDKKTVILKNNISTAPCHHSQIQIKNLR